MWFQLYYCTIPNLMQKEMIDALLVFFGPTYYENLDGMLARLQQGIGIVQKYQQFKRIANRVEGWSHCALWPHSSRDCAPISDKRF